MSEAVPPYDHLIARNSISALESSGDLTLRNGDIALTRWGDLMFNNADYSAFVRLVQTWRYNFPAMSATYRSMQRTFDEEASAEHTLNSLGGKPWGPALGPLGGLDPDGYHAASDRIAAARASRGVYSATIVLFLSRLLATFRADISANMAEWCGSGSLIAGCSFGQIVEAAANNVRHADEWLTASPPTSQQLKSVNVLAAVLGIPLPTNGSIRKFAADVSSPLLRLLSQDFLQLERCMFDFAGSLLATRESRAASL